MLADAGARIVSDQKRLPQQGRLQTGCANRTGYNTRHTFATTALTGNVNPAFIGRQIGHSDPGVTFKYYARWIDGSEAQIEAIKMNSAFSHTC